jgi:hypothetical protein
MRSFYGVSITDIGESVSFVEAVLLTRVLLKNPASWLQAELAGWSHPASHEWAVLAHTYDLVAQVNSKPNSRPKPYPTPWRDKSKTKLGAKHQPTDVVLEKLKKMNTNLEV